ncbi:hypothetical protein ACLEPN_16720 [Myxococcus sp. 1LA]
MLSPEELHVVEQTHVVERGAKGLQDHGILGHGQLDEALQCGNHPRVAGPPKKRLQPFLHRIGQCSLRVLDKACEQAWNIQRMPAREVIPPGAKVERAEPGAEPVRKLLDDFRERPRA